jgi:hypothetical protein
MSADFGFSPLKVTATPRDSFISKKRRSYPECKNQSEGRIFTVRVFRKNTLR